MSDRRSVCVVTTTRADYGLLHWPCRLIRESHELELQLVVAGTHLRPDFGETVREIEADGLPVARRLDFLSEDDGPLATVAALARFTGQMGTCLAELEPDLLMVLGDRWEILAPVQAATLLGVPVAHVAGGDVTLGALDDAVRHAVTKLSHLHFCTNADAEARLLAMGEAPERVHRVGSPGLDYIRRADLMDRTGLEKELGRSLAERVALVSYHRPTRGGVPWEEELDALLSALEGLGEGWSLAVSASNADPGARAVTRRLRSFADGDARAHWVTSAGQRTWLSLMKAADVMVGNSSAGLYEAPFLGTPTVNVGTRQAGRPRAASVIDVPGESGAVRRAIDEALAGGATPGDSPYGDGHAAERMVQVLEGLEEPSRLLDKTFHDGGDRG